MKLTPKRTGSTCVKYFIFLFTIGIFTHLTIQAQEIINKANQFNDQYKQEKIYLHIDRPSYWANEDLWFKAYLKDSPKPDCNLYVELLNEKGTVIYKKICWAQQGLAYGDIHLADTLTSGMYQVRAYTNWMRNFDEQWYFRRDLLIWNLRDRTKTPVVDQLKGRKVDFQFLSEGGTFLSGVKNRMAFKAIDQNGKGLEVSGVVLDNNGKQVVIFKSAFKGMGSFDITPEPGKKYSAQLTVGGDIPLIKDLPEALTSGVNLSFDAKDTTRVHLEVHEKGNLSSEKYKLIAQSEGKVCYQAEVPVHLGNGILDIDRKKFPTGIVRFTLFDASSLPLCERLVFINRHDQIPLKIEVEEKVYHPREKVSLDISALDRDENPVLANLSVSVYQPETMHQLEQYPENILTRFLLSSELKGKVEEPAFYFKDDSLSTLLALDNLMLTHGYRYFGWKQVKENQQPVVSFQPESGIQLKGTVLSDLLHKPVPNAKITMMRVNPLMSMQEQTSDSAGHFVFPDLFFNDTLEVVLKMEKKNGRAVSGIKIDTSTFLSPKASILPLTYDYLKENNFETVTYLSELSPDFLNRKWHLSDTILLADVNVKASKKQIRVDVPRPYLEADQVIDFKKINNVYANWMDALEMNSPLYRSFLDRGGRYFINGVIDQGNFVGNLPDSWIDKVELVRMTYIPGQGYGPGIYVYTKRGVVNEKIEYSPGIRPVTLMGFSIIRNYYSPEYDGKKDEQNEKKDYRSSLYWNPVIFTDSDGLSEVSFYNSDQLGEVQVVVEGLSKEGKICRGTYNYSVVPKK